MRQKIRKGMLIISFILFPVTIWYFSPYLIMLAASEHVINGSFIVFGLMFVLSMFFGRIWCGYLCPAGGIQECLSACNDRNAKQGKRDKIKYVIWVIWIIALTTTFVLAKNDVRIDPFFMTDHGISVSEAGDYIIYYGVMLILVLPSVIHGKRATCHYLCWMAPFLVLGNKLGRKLNLSRLHIEADKSMCISCGRCNRVCPMGLDVKQMVEDNKNKSCSECIQCGACVDECPKKVLSYSFKRDK